MARTRSETFETLYALQIGHEAVVLPASGEPVEQTLRRVKERVARWAKDERSYRCRIDGGMVRVQRTRFGMNRRIADLQALRAGEYLLLRDKPTAADVKRAQDQADYTTRTYPEGSWVAIRDQHGRLLILCASDVDGKSAERLSETVGPNAVVRKPWAGTWA